MCPFLFFSRTEPGTDEGPMIKVLEVSDRLESQELKTLYWGIERNTISFDCVLVGL